MRGFDRYLVCVFLGSCSIAMLSAQQVERSFSSPGANVALQKTYQLDPQPNYDYCTDPGDVHQLTDGKPVRIDGSFWTGQGCVGWIRSGLVNITIDVGQIVPIGGMSFSTAAGGAGVAWPAAILVLVSDDGETFRYVGELRTLSARHGAPPGNDIARHKFRTNALRARGRFVRLGIVSSGPFVFCDEIEIHRGADELLNASLEGPVVADLNAFVSERRTALALASWVSADVAQVRRAISSSTIDEKKRTLLNQTVADVDAVNTVIGDKPPADYRAIYPLSKNHGRLGKVVAQLRRATGYPSLFTWRSDRWQILRPFDAPPAAIRSTTQTGPRLAVRMMANERRSEILNVANFTDETLNATVTFAGLPGGKTPEYVSVRQVEYVAMQAGSWDADALPLARRDADGWKVTLPAGVSRQIWFSFYPQETPRPGRFAGQVVVELEESRQKFLSELELVIEPFRLPDEPTLALTMWDYTAGGGMYAMNAGNIPAAIAHMRSYNYNAPWATSGVLPIPLSEDFDEDGNLNTSLDFSEFDEWVSRWPDARYYMIFIESMVGRSESYAFAGAAVGTAEFEQRLSATARAWADHARKVDVDPHRIALLLIDEPGGSEQAERVVAWANAIKAGAPELLIYEDPHIAPHEAAALEMLELCDIVCPPIGKYRSGGRQMANAFEKLRQGGRELWFYSSPTQGPGTFYRDHAWECWKAQATGLGFWAYGDAGGTVNSWNQPSAPGPIYTPVYIDFHSVTDSKRWLAIIEGIQDYEYLRMLRDRVAELQAAGDNGENVRQAKALLQRLPDQILTGEFSFDDGRIQILDALARVRKITAAK